MPNDSKYGRLELERPGANPPADDEPVFLLRAQDVAAGPTLAEYGRLCSAAGSGDAHLDGIRAAMRAFADWQVAHPGLVKVPD